MESRNPKLTPRKFTTTLMILHLFFTVPPLLFGLFVLYNAKEPKLTLDMSDPFIFIVPIGAIVGIFLSNFLYKKNIKSVDDADTLKGKLARFQTASIIGYAPIEGIALLGIVAANNSSNILFLLISFMLLIYLFLQRPTKYKILQSLNLNSEMTQQFNKPDQEIE